MGDIDQVQPAIDPTENPRAVEPFQPFRSEIKGNQGNDAEVGGFGLGNAKTAFIRGFLSLFAVD